MKMELTFHQPRIRGRWREESANIIAINLQRMFRGARVRRQLLFERWLEMNKAAATIQRAFITLRERRAAAIETSAVLLLKNEKRSQLLDRLFTQRHHRVIHYIP
jgi:hypothetical protein